VEAIIHITILAEFRYIFSFRDAVKQMFIYTYMFWKKVCTKM